MNREVIVLQIMNIDEVIIKNRCHSCLHTYIQFEVYIVTNINTFEFLYSLLVVSGWWAKLLILMALSLGFIVQLIFVLIWYGSNMFNLIQ